MMALDYRVFRLPRALELTTLLGNMKSTPMVIDNILELNDNWKEKQSALYQFKKPPYFEFTTANRPPWSHR